MKRLGRAVRTSTSARRVSARAHAKINLTLRVGSRRADGYHDLHTVFQSLALHDTVQCVERPGPLTVVCRAPLVPTDHTNLVWRAAALLWHRIERPGEPRDAVVHVNKRIPVQAGLGGGSSDGVAALRALAALWRVSLTPERLVELAASLGADARERATGRWVGRRSDRGALAGVESQHERRRLVFHG